ncbi:hypothetical protein BESB_052850 [Besnoitia besnoiti]|uniref:Uncharacterized protein n=1 Tax=Besnoitia besnoiti TaxID=94643 RepID=A0A2A9MEK0_BESBE|nr:hypothetical protein BESB_052850 [Besnoitia besnoiti]PFH35634.1 hypothetical protein BESB_052850 [Besnoitia besnoiti]
MVFTQVLNDAYNGGTDGIHKATLFSQELSNSVDYTAEAMEKFVDMIEPIKGVASICYPASASEIPEKCSKAYEYGDTVYVPITRSTVSPTTNEAYSGGLWRDPSEKLDKEWYESIRLLKKQVHKLKVFALYTGRPDEKLLHYLLGEYRLIFDGLLIDWEFGPGACWSEVQKSPPNNNWMWFVKEKTRYMMANQDPATCVNADGSRADKDVFLNTGERSLQIQDYLLPVFPCYNGSEWRCHSAIKERPSLACDDQRQRYAFALFEINSAAALKFFLKTCKSHSGRTPAYDLVQVL